MSRLGGAAAVAPLVADMSSEVNILNIHLQIISEIQDLEIMYSLFFN